MEPQRTHGYKGETLAVSPNRAERFSSILLTQISGLVRIVAIPRYQLSASAYRREMGNRFQSWQEITSPALAA